jgi:hypothetical protein
MQGKRWLIASAAMAVTLCNGALANEIYKWVDDEGNVYYEDRPSGASTEERLDISYNRTSQSAVQNRVDASNKARAAREEERADEEEAELEAAEAAAEEEARAQRCESYRARLQSYLESQRLYRTDDNGERVYLDEAQTAEARARTEELIAENCY